MARTDRAWKKWGEIDPYYGVLSSAEYRGDKLSSENLSRFFATGEEHIERVFSTIRSKIAPEFAPTFAVDYGCGTGRLAIPLAKRCREVAGVDISPVMLEEMEKNCAAAGVTNVRALEPNAALAELSNVDLAHSFIVMQHIPPTKGMQIIRQLVTALAPGGCIALHVTYERSANRMRKFANWLRHNVPGAHAIFQLIQRRPVSDPPMQMNHYPLNQLLRFLQERGFGHVHVEFTNHGGFLGAMIYGQLRQQPPGT